MTPENSQARLPDDRMAPFELCVQSGQMAVRETLEKLVFNLKKLNLDLEEIGTVELVLAEILNNIVEHAYPEGTPPGPIFVSCVQRAEGLFVEIRDQGKAMPDGQLPIGMLSPIDVETEDLPEGGFGWFLIQHLARDVSYERVNSENLLKVRLAVGLEQVTKR